MILLFICAGLEPGRDGVGDYTRLLASACLARGHRCILLALHDPHAARRLDDTAEALRVIRLPATTSWPERLSDAADLVRRLAPAWTSWQFVAYGFHPRGFLPGTLLQSAAQLRGPRCHIMLHELWLGLETGAPLRERVLGWLQRRGVTCLLDQLSADLVHTSNPAYRTTLARQGHPAKILPLFGNVPITPSAPFAASAAFTGVTFGTLHPQWRPAATADWLLATARRHARPPALLVLGRAGTHAAHLLNPFRDRDISVTETGELEPAAVSRHFSTADFGIAPHPWALIGKSGAAAAMLEHGLPVLVPRDDWSLRKPSSESAPDDPLLARLSDLDTIATDRWLASRRPPASALPRTADAFLQALETCP